ncbi:Glucose-induced degradation protein 4 like protein [Lucilia cuprina]|nr:Glucose-induced degradation protein 4 like protein [Lucilia cuprina]
MRYRHSVGENSSSHIDLDSSFLCGYLKISGLTFEFPTLTTFFDGEIISQKYPFLTRKWDADEETDKAHWTSTTTTTNVSTLAVNGGPRLSTLLIFASPSTKVCNQQQQQQQQPPQPPSLPFSLPPNRKW